MRYAIRSYYALAIAGAIGYIVNTPDTSVLPAFSLGYVYLPALAGIVRNNFV